MGHSMKIAKLVAAIDSKQMTILVSML